MKNAQHIGGLPVIEKLLTLYVSNTPNHPLKGLIEKVFRRKSAFYPSKRLQRNGLNWELDPSEFNQFWFILNRNMNQHVFHTLRKSLTPSGVTLDIGANIGTYTLQLAQEYSKLKNSSTLPAVLAFEPNPKTFSLLTKNISLNPQTAPIKTFNLGLGSETSTAELCFSDEYLGSSSLHHQDPTLNKVTIEIKRLDDVIAQMGIQQLDAIKIDVEGHELAVFKGAKNTLETLKPMVVYELNLDMHPSGAHEEFFGLFNQMGYKQYFIQRNGKYIHIPSANDLLKSKFEDIVAIPPHRLNLLK